MRNKVGLTQRELAELAGISIRTLQQYEQQKKSINNAKAETVVILAKVLCCGVEELLEHIEV